MDQRPSFVRNLWGLTILCLLREKPLHPYELRRLIVERNKSEFLDLKSGSLYHAVVRLQKAGLIEAFEANREGRRPERTIYCLTAAGERELLVWLSDLIRTVANDSRQFVAALSYLGHLAPKEACGLLEQRLEQTEQIVKAMEQSIGMLEPKIGRVLVLESEFAVAMHRSESMWIRSLIADLRAGRINWKFKFDGVGKQDESKSSRQKSKRRSHD